MVTKKGMLVVGILILLLPFAGVPSSWKTFLNIFFGLLVIISSITFSIPKKIVRNKSKKDKFEVEDVVLESIPIYPKDNLLPKEEVSPKKKISRTRKTIKIE